MKICLSFFFAVLSIGFPISSQGQGPEGTQLLRACGAAVKQQDGANVSDQEMIESLWCIGYVAGFLDSMSIAQAPGLVGKPHACHSVEFKTNKPYEFL